MLFSGCSWAGLPLRSGARLTLKIKPLDSLNTEDYLRLLQIAQQDSSDTAVRQRPVLDDGSPADVGEVLHPGLLQDLQQMAKAADLERGTQPLKAAVGYLLED